MVTVVSARAEVPTGAIGEALQLAWDESPTLPPIVLTETERGLLINAVLSFGAPIGENAPPTSANVQGTGGTAEGGRIER